MGGVFSASEFGILDIQVGFCLEENDLGRKFLRDVEEMVQKKKRVCENAVVRKIYYIGSRGWPDPNLILLTPFIGFLGLRALETPLKCGPRKCGLS